MNKQAVTDVQAVEAENLKALFSASSIINQFLSCRDLVARLRLQPKALIRRCELPFHRLVALMLNFRKGNIDLELTCSFATLVGVEVPLVAPTLAALRQNGQALGGEAVHPPQSRGHQNLLRRLGSDTLAEFSTAGPYVSTSRPTVAFRILV
jgi:hypothetical protein